MQYACTIMDLPSTDGDLSLVEQYEVQIASHRSELSEAYTHFDRR